jgi:drug/metabolite transporter (DMT)-like permease
VKRKKILGTGFLLLCLLRASAWIISPVTDSFPAVEQQAVLYGIAGIGTLLFAGRGLSTRLSPLIWTRLSLVSVGLFGFPVVLIGWARGSVTETGISALFAAVPAVVAMVLANGSEGVGLMFLTPALVAFGGVLLILPVDLPGSLRGDLQLAALILAIFLVGIASVRMFRLILQVAYLDAMIVIGLSNAIFLIICCIANGSLVWRWNQLAAIASIASLVDLIEMALLVWLLRAMSPIRLSARYLVIPLFTVIEGYIALGPQPTTRLLVGTALLTAGAAWILFAPIEEKEPALSLH